MDVIEDEGLHENSRVVGRQLAEGLRALRAGDDGIGDVRGAGLFVAADCVTDGAPDGRRARAIVNHMRRNGVLISATGPEGHVLKIRPPLVMQAGEARMLVDAVAAALEAL